MVHQLLGGGVIHFPVVGAADDGLAATLRRKADFECDVVEKRAMLLQVRQQPEFGWLEEVESSGYSSW